jgi:NAD(P)-dependent dehydrogenase (short-subunit alcohol dehydrogenase family)
LKGLYQKKRRIAKYKSEASCRIKIIVRPELQKHDQVAVVTLHKTLFKRFIQPEDVATACVYLASKEADNVTGQIMYIDGGLTAVG